MANCFERRAPRALPRGEEAAEAESIDGQSAGNERGNEGGRAGHGYNRNFALDGQANQAESRIGYGRRAGIAHHGYARPAGKFLDQFCRPLGFVVLMVADARCPNAVAIKELLRLPGVFAGNQLNFVAENAECSKRDVFQIAYRCRNKVEIAGQTYAV